MKYIITGSTGHISKPLTRQLVAAGGDVKVITSSDSKTAEIESLGAKPLIGSIEDVSFLKKSFEGADAVYLMIPPNFGVTDWPAHQRKVADNYVEAVKSSGVKHVVLLSSVGAHLRKGAGPIDGLGYLEERLGEVADLNLKILRPSYFYYNLFSMIGLVKQAGIMGGNYGEDGKLLLVHPSDIANVAASFLKDLSFTGTSIEYIASDEKSFAEIAQTLGTSIGKPEIPWVNFSDEDSKNGMLQAGLSETIADGYTQMGQAFRSGKAQEDFYAKGLKPTGKIKLEDFAKDFAAAFNG